MNDEIGTFLISRMLTKAGTAAAGAVAGTAAVGAMAHYGLGYDSAGMILTLDVRTFALALGAALSAAAVNYWKNGRR